MRRIASSRRGREPTPLVRRVWQAVRRVPRGKVVTYGQVAAMIGRPRAARAVGRALRSLTGPLASRVPWQRVINSAGRISPRESGAQELQKELLEREGVRVRRGRIDLRRLRWAGPRGSGMLKTPQRGRKRSPLGDRSID